MTTTTQAQVTDVIALKRAVQMLEIAARGNLISLQEDERNALLAIAKAALSAPPERQDVVSSHAELLAACKMAVSRPENITPAQLMKLSADTRDVIHTAIARAESLARVRGEK